jgi:lipopolysaccharide transport system ATP-binding protein
MSGEISLRAEQLTKSYRIWKDPAKRLTSPIYAELGRWLPDSLGRSLHRRSQDGYRDFFALDKVSFEVRRGEAVAIIGRNGAGKSTLLQLIAGTLQATTGSIQVNGRVAALLELGAGFNPDFTGRENVFLSGAILGLKQKEMESRFDEIAAFANIGDFIDQPVKTYSSGMMMRLAFAVNTCVDPEILIVDEALSVGDAPFQAKCFRRLRKLIDEGTTLLFVSHDIGTVRSICSRALWLKDGRVEMWGEAKEVAKHYERFCWAEQGVALDAINDAQTSDEITAADGLNLSTSLEAINLSQEEIPADLFVLNDEFSQLRDKSRYGTQVVSIENVIATNFSGRRTAIFDYAETAVFWILFTLNRAVDSDCVISFLLRDIKGNSVIATQDVSNFSRLQGRKGQRYVAQTKLPLTLHHQQYVLHTAVFGFQSGSALQNGAYDFGNAILWDVVDEAALIEVRTCSKMPLSGPVHLDSPVTIRRIE